MLRLFRKFARDESGATAIEYGLIAAGVSIAIVTILPTFGTNLSAKFKKVSDAVAQ